MRSSGATVQEAFFHRQSADSWGVTGAEGTFCFVGIAIATGAMPPVDAFTLQAGGESLQLGPSVAETDPMVLSGRVSAGQAYERESAVRTMRFMARPRSDRQTLHRYTVVGGDTVIQRTVPGTGITGRGRTRRRSA